MIARLILSMAVVATMLASTASAATEHPSPKRKVAVLEYRSGSSALPQLASRIADVLRTSTSLQIVSPDQARALLGEGLDETIVKCAGTAECLARLGQKAGVAEIVLVGISEFGGVIVTLQRITVRDSIVGGRVAESIDANQIPNNQQLLAYLSRLMPPSDFLQFGVLDIVANVAGATVTVSGKSRGQTPLPALRVDAPATYEIKIDKPGYVGFRATVAVPPEGTMQVKAELALRSPRAWYSRWWVLTAAGVIVAGSTAAVIYATTSNAASSTVPVTGTIK
jgi:hypothetical protein